MGSGTEVDHIQVHFNKDDGVEFFGGSVNAKYILLTGNATNRTVDPGLRNALSKLQPDFRPNLNSPALNLNFVATPPDDGFFDSSVDRFAAPALFPVSGRERTPSRFTRQEGLGAATEFEKVVYPKLPAADPSANASAAVSSHRAARGAEHS